MNAFLERHGISVVGMLQGFDRLRLRGTLRPLAYVGGMMGYLSRIGVLLKDFKEYAFSVTEQIRRTSEGVAEAAELPVEHLPSSSVRKEHVAREIARQMDRAGIAYVRRDNCFLQITNVARAQWLMDKKLRVNFRKMLDKLVPRFNPARLKVFRPKEGGWNYRASHDRSAAASDTANRTHTGLRVPPHAGSRAPKPIMHGCRKDTGDCAQAVEPLFPSLCLRAQQYNSLGMLFAPFAKRHNWWFLHEGDGLTFSGARDGGPLCVIKRIPEAFRPTIEDQEDIFVDIAADAETVDLAVFLSSVNHGHLG